MQVEVLPLPCFNLHTLKVSSAVNPNYGMESNENKIVFQGSRTQKKILDRLLLKMLELDLYKIKRCFWSYKCKTEHECHTKRLEPAKSLPC